MLFGISDPVALAIVALINVVVVAVGGWVTFLLKEWADRKRDERAVVLEKKIDAVAKVGKVTHDLANSAMLSQKRMMADVSKAKAKATNDPADHVLAVEAERVYQEHLAGQELSDQKEIAASKVIAAAKAAEHQSDDKKG